MNDLKSRYIKFIIFLLFFSVQTLYCKDCVVSGVIKDQHSKNGVEHVLIYNDEFRNWTTTNKRGEFVVKSTTNCLFISIRSLGYAENRVEICSSNDSNIVYINPLSLALKEVCVVSMQSLDSKTIIGRLALEHAQPLAITDLMQLMPGQLTINPDFKENKSFTIRDYDIPGKNANGFGTAIMIDGATISNNGNMQTSRTTNQFTGTLSNRFSTSVNNGSDGRMISVANIESVEVIRGVAGAEYGDFTDGMVKINTKMGAMPLQVAIKSDHTNRQISISKGSLLRNQKGVLNVSFGYLNSYDDIRIRYNGFNRTSGTIGYSNTFFRASKPLTFNAKVQTEISNDTYKSDPDLLRGEKFITSEKMVVASMFGKWFINSGMITNLDYNISHQINNQYNSEVRLKSSAGGQSPYTTATNSGNFVGNYLASEYFSEVEVFGKPSTFTAKISSDKAYNLRSVTMKTVVGAEYRNEQNNGDGIVFDMSKPLYPNIFNAARPRSFKDIPSLNSFVLFGSQKIVASVFKTTMDANIGMRFTSSGANKENEMLNALDPRISVNWHVSKADKEKAVSGLKFAFGYGVFSKMPSLLQCYPEPLYFDLPVFNYVDTGYKYNVINTKYFENIPNSQLLAARNVKKELSGALQLYGRKISCTLFDENTKNGFSYNSRFDSYSFRNFEPLAAGYKPYYVADLQQVVYLDNNNVPKFVNHRTDTVFANYSQASNSMMMHKQGAEFFIELGHIRQIRTKLDINGGYFTIRKQNITNILEYPTVSVLDKKHPFVAIYPSGFGTEQQRLSANVQSVTHLPSIQMVFSFLFQFVVIDRYRTIYQNNEFGDVFYANAIDGRKVVAPIGYINKAMEYKNFSNSATDKSIYDYFVKYYYSSFYNWESFPSRLNINMRLTKEFGSKTKFSFFANNVFDNRPLFLSKKVTGNTQFLNSSLYFGAEIQISL